MIIVLLCISVSVPVHQDSNNIHQDDDNKDDIDNVGDDNLSGHPGCHLHQNQTRYIQRQNMLQVSCITIIVNN